MKVNIDGVWKDEAITVSSNSFLTNFFNSYLGSAKVVIKSSVIETKTYVGENLIQTFTPNSMYLYIPSNEIWVYRNCVYASNTIDSIGTFNPSQSVPIATIQSLITKYGIDGVLFLSRFKS